MKILGLAFETHESGAALLDGDKILSVVSEERLSRIKMDEAAPVRATQECLRIAGVKPSEIDLIALSGFPPVKKLIQYARYIYKPFLFTNGYSMGMTVFPNGSVVNGPLAYLYNSALSTGLPQYTLIYRRRLKQVLDVLPGFRGRIVHVPHHDCHASSAYFAGPWEECLSVIVEGSDWEHSAVIETVRDGRFERVASTPWPHSAGAFYKLITRILGFNPRRHAGKITGLAAYGDPNAEYEKVKALMWAEGMELRVSPLVFSLHTEYVRTRKLPGYFGGAPKENLAAAFQRVLEEVVEAIVRRAVEKTGMKRIVLAGGCVANVKMNQRIQEIPGVEAVSIHPGMGDVGQPLGAALKALDLEMRKNGSGGLKPRPLKDVYFGPAYSDDEIERELRASGLPFERPAELEKTVAEAIHSGKVVCRFNGRMEYGPRALGNRSILYHAKDQTVNAWLNKRLARTEFMPFAPSTLIEYADQCFKNVNGSKHSAEFMTITYDCTDWMKKTCPAVVHVDGTARPQLVSKDVNPTYHKVIDEYRKISGIPTVVNTSYNMHEEPIVCSPNDSIRAFKAAGLDHLALGPFWVRQGDGGKK